MSRIIYLLVIAASVYAMLYPVITKLQTIAASLQ